MILSAHQPHFLPWLGYLDRMMRADLFVLLDHVQFERANFQNRTGIRFNGRSQLITVPVQQFSQKERIIDKRIDNPPTLEPRWWGSNLYETLRHAYRRAPFFDLYAPSIKAILDRRYTHLVDLNQAMLDFLREVLDIRTPLVRSSDLNLQGQKSDMILNLCQVLGADVYLAGMGASRNYLDREAFERAGVRIAFQEFRHPLYSQCGKEPFIKGLSALDLLFNHGPQSAALLHSLVEADAAPAEQEVPMRKTEPAVDAGYAQQSGLAAAAASPAV